MLRKCQPSVFYVVTKELHLTAVLSQTVHIGLPEDSEPKYVTLITIVKLFELTD